MKTLNYALAGGNKTLLQIQAEDKTMAMQLWYSGILAATVTVEVWVSTDPAGPYSKIEAATKTLVPADGTTVITLSGTSFLYVQFRLVTGSASVGTINKIDFQAGVNPIY